jgi:uncharacterized protein YjbI with pentapeptide repeats
MNDVSMKDLDAPRAPKLAKARQRDVVTVKDLVDEAMIGESALQTVDARSIVAQHLTIAGSSVTDSVFGDAELEQLALTDVLATGSDFSNTQLFEARWTRVVLRDCKLVGARLNQASLRDVRLERCSAELIQMQQAKCERVAFSGCRFRGGMFNDSTLANVQFDGCDLREADFMGASVSGVDFRNSDLDGIRIGPEQLRGVIVTSDQALYLAGAMGLDIRG